MKEWVILFRILDNEGSNVEVENKLSKSLAFGRFLAYFYWIGIATVAWFGVLNRFFKFKTQRDIFNVSRL